MRKVLYILGLLEDQDIDWLVGIGRRCSVAAGEVLVREGTAATDLFVVVEGNVDVSVGGRVLAQIGQGEVVGEISLLDSRPSSATVTAAGPTLLLAVSFTELKAKLARDMAFAARLYQALGVFLAQRLRRQNLQMLVGDVATASLADEEDADEIDPDVLERITLAGSRFRWIIEKMSKG